MTISTTSNEVVAQGNGLTTSFDFTFPVPLASELYVYYTDSTGAISAIPSTQYSVTGIGTSNGGAVTYPLSGSPIATGTSLTIQRIVAYQQLTDLVNQSGYYPNVVENALDYLTMQTQQLAQETALSLQVPFSASPASLTYPGAAGRANKLAGFDSLGNATAYPISSSVGAGNLTSEGPFVAGANFTAGVTTVLTLSQAYGSAANVNVHFDGVYQGPDQYSLNGTQITFTAPIPVGTNKVYIVGGTTLSAGTVSDGSIGTTKLADLAVTTAKLAANSVTSAKLANASVGASQLSWGAILSRVVDSIAALAALDPTVYTRTFVTGYYAAGDGGGGAYYYSASTSQASANGGSIIAASGGVGCWLLLIQNSAVNVHQFGAKGDGATDDAAAITAAFASSASLIFLSNKIYRIASGITVPQGKALHGIAPGSYDVATDSFPAIVGDASIPTIVAVTGGGTTEGVAISNVLITRAAGSIPVGSIGVAMTNSSNSITARDVLSMRSDIGFSVGDGAFTSLGVHLVRCYTGVITGYHIKISNVVEVTVTDSRFGRNGGTDGSSAGYVNINGATVDTVRFTTVQFNISGGTAGVVIGFTGYASNPNGIISFMHCHMEQWANLISADSGTSSIRSLRFVGNTIDSGSGSLFYNGGSNKLTELMLVGNRLDGGFSVTLDQQLLSVIQGNHFGGTVLINAGTQVVTGNYFDAAVTLQGATARTIFVGNAVAGGLSNTMSGTFSIVNNI